MQATDDKVLMARRLEWADAQALAGETVAVFAEEGGAPVAFAVVAVKEQHRAPHMLQFSVSLRGPPKPVQAQRTYRVRHARLGDYAFFITPVGANESGVDYEACFSHAP